MKSAKLNVFYEPGIEHPKAHPGQEKILNVLDEGTRWVLIRCGRKFGKTKLLIAWLVEMAIKTGLVCPYIAPNKVQAKNITWDDHIQKLLWHFKEIGVPYKTNEVELSVELPRGKIQLFGVENADALRGISNWGAVALDEYDDWEHDIWPLIIRPNLAPHLAPAIVAGTPKGYKNLYRLEDEGIFKCFHFTSHDNPTLDPEELKAMEKEYRSFGESYYRQEILAQYERPFGTVYDEWPSDNFKELKYDAFLPLHMTLDFGVNDPTAIIWIQPNGAEFRVIDYYEASEANIDHFISVIRSKPYKKPELVTGDAAGKARSLTTNTSPIDEYAKAGIHIRTKDALLIPDQIRITHKYIPSTYLGKKAIRLRDCLMNYRYPATKDSSVNQSNEIPIHDQWSHGARALEYYFANIDGSGLLREQAKEVRFDNRLKAKSWSIG